MSSSIGIATKCVTTFLDFLHIVQAVDKYSESESSILQTANVVNRLALFGFSATEIKKLTCNPSDNHALACLKNSELTSRYVNLLIQVFKGPKRFEETETELQFLERAVILPVSDIVRVSAEKSAYEIRRRYDSILRYRKALLQSGELQNPEGFIANLKQIFEEICTLNDANDTKDASASVRAFFQKGVLDAYDISYLNTLDPCEACKRRHNQDLNDRKEETFQSISLQEFDQSRFIINELNLEIEKIKTKKEELIEDFCKPNS
ncbi:MAG: hypothetical protein AABZ92_03250 [Verrucomicrobiota bacterium]